MKIKSKIKNYQLVIRVKSSHEESINLNEVERLSKFSPRGFLRPRILKPNIIEYTGPMGISLYERLKRPINKKDFLLILEQVVSAVQKLQTNGFGIGKAENGALNEAMSDIFGEILESFVTGDDIDWRNKFRNIADPSVRNNPDFYMGDNWGDTSNPNFDNDNGYVHRNSTVISHAAYLMWNSCHLKNYPCILKKACSDDII